MRHALVNDGEIVEFRGYAPNVDQSELAAGKPRMLQVETIRDDYDPVSQMLDGPAYTVHSDKVVERYTSRPKNPDEIARMIAAKDADIEAEFARRCTDLIDFEVGGVTYQFHADAEAIGNIQGRLNMYTEADRMGAPLPDPLTWKPKGAAPIGITRNETALLGMAIGARKDALFMVKVPKQIALAAMTDPVEIASVDPLAGWDIA